MAHSITKNNSYQTTEEEPMLYQSAQVTSTLQALCRQEEGCYQVCGNYLDLNSVMDASHKSPSTSSSQSQTQQQNHRVVRRRARCRSAMVTWCCTVVDYLEFERDTVVTAMNLLDRFLDTSVGATCLTTPRQFKIAGMTCLYTAIKAHEPEAMEPDLVVELSGNLCQVEDVEAMERSLLSALEWRVNPPTPLAFCRQLLAIVPKGLASKHERAALLELAQVQTELAVADSRLITKPPSLVALASVFNALESRQSSMETLDDLSQLFFMALNGSQNLNMDEVFDIQDILDDIIRQHNQKEQEAAEAEEQAAADQEQHNQEDHLLPAEEQPSDSLPAEATELEDGSASPTTPAREMALQQQQQQQQVTDNKAVSSPMPPVRLSPSAQRTKSAEAA